MDKTRDVVSFQSKVRRDGDGLGRPGSRSGPVRTPSPNRREGPGSLFPSSLTLHRTLIRNEVPGFLQTKPHFPGGGLSDPRDIRETGTGVVPVRTTRSTERHAGLLRSLNLPTHRPHRTPVDPLPRLAPTVLLSSFPGKQE